MSHSLSDSAASSDSDDQTIPYSPPEMKRSRVGRSSQRQQWVVESIEAQRGGADGSAAFVLVRWAGYVEATWEPIQALRHTTAFERFMEAEQEKQRNAAAAARAARYPVRHRIRGPARRVLSAEEHARWDFDL